MERGINSRMVELLARLADWPSVSGAKTLSGNLAGHYRLRNRLCAKASEPVPITDEALPPLPKPEK